MFSSTVVIALIGTAVTLIGSILTYKLGLKNAQLQSKKEEDSAERAEHLVEVKKLEATWNRISVLEGKLEILSSQNLVLATENAELKVRLEIFSTENASLKSKIESYLRENQSMKEEIRILKEELSGIK